ncbi:MAG: trigger factor [Synergistaceae bacterium]|nr:trigger factor [Synergistaceae bacterium]
MKSEILSQERNVAVVKIEYEAGEVDRAVAHTVREFSNKANIKGFRKGHVPRKTLELYIGKNAIYKEALEHLANEALDNVVTEYELDLIVDPKCKLGELSEGNPLDLEFTFEVRPEVTLPDISSLKAEKTVYTVRDEEVEEGIKQVLESSAELVPTDDDRPAEREDIVDTQYSSFALEADGSLKELERDKKNVLHLSNLRNDIAEAIIGHKPAEELTFDINLEDDYPDSRMAGRKVRYELEILRFMKRVVPEPTDEKIAELSKGKYQTADELKSAMRRQLEESAAARSEATLQDSAIKALARASAVDVPESMVDRQYLSMRSDRDGQLQQNLRQSLDDYLKQNNLSVEEFDSNLKKRAEEAVKNTLVLDALAERDDISFTSDELNEEIMLMAQSMRMNPQELADSLGKDKQEFAGLAMRVRTKNAVKHLASLVQVEEHAPEEHEHDHDHGHDGHEHEAAEE